MNVAEMLTEPVFVPITKIDGLSHIEDSDDGSHTLVFFSTRQSPYGGNDYIVEIRMAAGYTAILKGVVTVMRHMGARFRAAVLRAVYGGRTVH